MRSHHLQYSMFVCCKKRHHLYLFASIRLCSDDNLFAHCGHAVQSPRDCTAAYYNGRHVSQATTRVICVNIVRCSATLVCAYWGIRSINFQPQHNAVLICSFRTLGEYRVRILTKTVKKKQIFILFMLTLG